jgi:hypothetical protein
MVSRITVFYAVHPSCNLGFCCYIIVACALCIYFKRKEKETLKYHDMKIEIFSSERLGHNMNTEHHENPKSINATFSYKCWDPHADSYSDWFYGLLHSVVL